MSDYGGGVNVWEDRISVFTPAQRFHGLYLILSHARTHINTHTQMSYINWIKSDTKNI